MERGKQGGGFFGNRGEMNERGEEGERKEGCDERTRGEGGKFIEGQKVKKRGRGSGVCKIAFWNVAKLENKNVDFSKGLKKWDVVLMMETWLEDKGWERIRRKLPKEFVWSMQPAVRINKKGMAREGLVMGIRKGIAEYVTDERRRRGDNGR